jgi:3-oxoacyl-[acyl-carrier protein] reductase
MRNVLITGASRGLGLAIAERLLDGGFRVIASARKSTEGLEGLQSRRGDGKGELVFTPFDLANTDGIPGFVKNVINQHGPIYGLVNNAALGLDGVLPTMHASQIHELVRLNLIAPILLTKYASRPMLLKRQGRIINISSIIATTGYSGLSVYAATKAGLIGFTRSLARELGKANITVNAVAPGYMETDMTAGMDLEKRERISRRCALGRLPTVREAAEAVGFLISDQAQGITGTVVTVDAGSTA